MRLRLGDKQVAEYILEAQGIVKTFPGVKALDGVDLKLAKGSVHALVGENGAGKSTLMLILGGIYPPDAGQIIVEGKEVSFESSHDANREGISVVYQELSLVPNLSVAENIFAHRQPVKRFNMVDWKTLFKETQQMLSIFDIEGKLVFSSSKPGKGEGTIKFYWDGTDNSGKGVPSGVYLVKVDNGSQKFVDNILILR